MLVSIQNGRQYFRANLPPLAGVQLHAECEQDPRHVGGRRVDLHLLLSRQERNQHFFLIRDQPPQLYPGMTVEGERGHEYGVIDAPVPQLDRIASGVGAQQRSMVLARKPTYVEYVPEVGRTCQAEVKPERTPGKILHDPREVECLAQFDPLLDGEGMAKVFGGNAVKFYRL